MPILNVIITVFIIFIIVSFFLNLLLNPIVWVIILAFMVYGNFKRKAIKKQMDEYNQQFEQETRQRKSQYTQNSNEDIIDVNYTEIDD